MTERIAHPTTIGSEDVPTEGPNNPNTISVQPRAAGHQVEYELELAMLRFALQQRTDECEALRGAVDRLQAETADPEMQQVIQQYERVIESLDQSPCNECDRNRRGGVLAMITSAITGR